MDIQILQLSEKIREQAQFVQAIRQELQKTLVGQTYMIDRLLIGLLTGGHILLEGVPGLAKTLAIKSLSQATSAKFSRIQFTPDLLPADVIGTMIYNPRTAEFSVRKGPIFANLVLADEINRAPAKVQSALLEAMQEKQVTIGENTFSLPSPFLVMATQNPLEQEGTYPLPEAQCDRFLLKCLISYPSMSEEQEVLRQQTGNQVSDIKAVANLEQIAQARELVRAIYLDEKIEKYILQIVFASREPQKYKLDKLKNLIAYGGSPRATISLALAAKAQAYLSGRGYVIPDDVRAIASDVLRHRIGLTYEAEAEGVNREEIISTILAAIEVP